MADIGRAALFGKLNKAGYKSMEAATVFCRMRGNPYVEMVHWLHQVMQLQDSDFKRIVDYYQLNPSVLSRDIIESLDRLPRGAGSTTDLSSQVEQAVERAWLYATLMFSESRIRSGHMIVGMLKDHSLKLALLDISKEFAKIRIEQLTEIYGQIVSGSPERDMTAADGSHLAGGEPGQQSGETMPVMGGGQALARFSVDLTEKARRGELDPIVGRDNEIRQIIDILMRRRQNNPIITGEAGVGKTAVVEGFAQRIADGDVPPVIKDVSLRTLDLGLLQAGASMKGEFEDRLRQVIEEVQASPKPIVLFIDEAHTLIGAGGSAGTGDAANLLKPALARGTLRTIAATTWGEYKKYFEKDPALTRRFQVIQVDEPGEDKAVLMMRRMAQTLENHHKVQVLDEALEASVKLSHRYIPARQLPDKSVSLLDTACARVAVSQHAIPAEVEDSRRRIQALKVELDIIGREAAVGMETGDREARASEALAAEKDRLAMLEQRWKQEKEIVDRILELRSRLRDSADSSAGENAGLEVGVNVKVDGEPGAQASAMERETLTPDQVEDYQGELNHLQRKLQEMQQQRPLILPGVDAQAVASVVADWTGIPVGSMVKNDVEAVLNLANTLKRRVIGQDHALEMISKRIRTTRARLDNPNKPIGVFLLCGPSGVGKTETGLTLAESLFGSEQNVITLNMSEFQEAHTVSTLKGSPPGYVGYGEGGVLTEAVRRKPYSVVLLDEVEKAHPDVHEIFFQVFDKGWMEDAEGRYIDFKNTIILLTSNAGTDLIMDMCRDPELMPDVEGLTRGLREPLLKIFPAALLGRLVVIPYYPLNDDMLGAIIRLQLGRIQQRIRENHGILFKYDDEVIKLIGARCTEVESGARMVDAILTNTVLPEISKSILNHMVADEPIGEIRLREREGDIEYDYQ